jgi:hypothetical protein
VKQLTLPSWSSFIHFAQARGIYSSPQQNLLNPQALPECSVKMAKFKLPWLGLNSPSSTHTEKKTANRRSHFGRKEVEANGDVKLAPSTARAPVEPASRMSVLALTIARETEKLEAYFKANNLPAPSFDVNAPFDFPRLPEDILQSRQEIIFATKELSLLAHGPRESIRWGVWEFLDVLALQVVNHFGIGESPRRPCREFIILTLIAAKLFLADQTITLAKLQAKTSLDPTNLARVLRLVMTKGIFCEPRPGEIAHTAASRVLAEDGDLQAWVGFNSEDIFPAAGHVLQSLKAHPEATSLTRAGFCFAFDTVDKEPMFVTFGKDPNRARRMGKAMASLTGGEGYEISYLIDVERGGYDFSEIDAVSGTLVDVGGSHGFVCVDLAKKYKNMKFVVQDLPKTVDSAPSPISDDAQIAERITLQAHDFFTEQVTKGADGET